MSWSSTVNSSVVVVMAETSANRGDPGEVPTVLRRGAPGIVPGRRPGRAPACRVARPAAADRRSGKCPGGRGGRTVVVLVQPAASLTDLALGVVTLLLAWRLPRGGDASRYWRAGSAGRR